MKRTRPKTLSPFLKSPSGRKALWGFLLFLLFPFLFAVLLTGSREEIGLKQAYFIGEPARTAFYSPIEAAFLDKELTRQKKIEAEEAVLPVYRKDKSVFLAGSQRLSDLLATIEAGRIRSGDPASETQPSPALSEDDWKMLMDLRAEDWEIFRHALMEIYETVYSKGLISSQSKFELLGRQIQTINFLSGEKEGETDVLSMKTVEDADWQIDRLVRDLRLKSKVRDFIQTLLKTNLAPDVFFDSEETLAREQSASNAVEPVRLHIHEGELMVARGVLVSEAVKDRIDIVQGEVKKKKRRFNFIVLVLVLYLISLLAFIYFRIFEWRSFKKPSRPLLFHLALIVNLIFCKAVLFWQATSVYWMPVVLAPMVLSLLLNVRVGIWSAIYMTCFVGFMSEFQPDLIFAALLGSIAASCFSIRLTKRVHFLRTGILVALIYAAVILLIQLYQNGPLVLSAFNALWGGASVLFVTIPLCFVCLYAFENLFDMVTDISLLELSDLNHPLLKQMVLKAPGTYHHSLVVSRLAESACRAIGANALLARVGCYFHDIGKMLRSDHFTENQRDMIRNPHEVLDPYESCRIIIKHVSKGIELGRKNRLKKPVLDFIPEHQGTGVIYYFYRKAQDAAPPGVQVKVEDFRYPGPKPQSKETAVALLADSVEAASRSVQDPSPEKLKQLVRKIINDKFIDGQLDECDLTLRDLFRIQRSFVYDLLGIFHSRISYPSSKKDESLPDLFTKNQFSKFRSES